MRHERVLLGLAQTLFHSLLDPCQTGAVLVLGQLAHAAHAAVTQVVDVVHFAIAVAQVHQNLDHSQDVFVGQHHGAGGAFVAHLGIELHAPHARQVVGVGVVEQALEQGLHRVFGRWLAGAHHAVDGDAGGEFVHGFINTQGLRDVGALVEFVGVDALQIPHTRGAQFFQQCFRQLFVGLGQDFAGIGIHHGAGHHATDQEIFGHADVHGPRLFQFTRMAGSDALVLGHDNLTGFVSDVKAGHFAAQALGDKFHLRTAVHQTEVVVDEEVRQDGLRVQANGLEQNRDRHLATAVHAEIKNVLGIELKIEPGTTVGNDAGAEQQLARTVGLALVVLKEHTGRAVQLRDDHTFGTVDDERTFLGHEWHFTHVDLLLFHLFDHFGLRSRRLTVVNDQLHLGAHSRGKSQPAGLAFAHIKGRLGKVVFEKLHLDKTIVRNNGKSSIECRLQAFMGAFFGRHIGLKERGIRIFLHLQQIRNLQHAVAAAETFANSLAFGVGIGHEISGQRLESWVCDD